MCTSSIYVTVRMCVCVCVCVRERGFVSLQDLRGRRFSRSTASPIVIDETERRDAELRSAAYRRAARLGGPVRGAAQMRLVGKPTSELYMNIYYQVNVLFSPTAWLTRPLD